MAHRSRLVGGFFRASDHILLRDRLDPEARRKIGQVRDDGDKRTAGINLVPALANLPVEMRDYGDEQVRRFFAPKSFEQIYQRPVKYADGGLENAQEIRAAKGPAVLQQDIVLLLYTNPGEFAQNVQPVRQVLELDEFDLPVTLLLGNYRL